MVTDDQKVLRFSAGIDMGNDKWNVPSLLSRLIIMYSKGKA